MFHTHKRLFIISAFILALLLVLAACAQEPVEVTRVVEVPGAQVEVTRLVEVAGPEVEVTRVVEVMAEPETLVSVVPFEAKWATSGHADVTAEAFNHWNEEDPKEIPANCAKCHSTAGYLDFVGADGSAAGAVDAAAPIGSVVQCEACHNDATLSLSSVVFPSGLEVTGLGAEARCMQCHQGRASTVTVNNAVANAGLTAEDEDTVSADLGFSNIHYFAAAATLYGTAAQGGYQYEGQMYDAKFDHVPGLDTCVDCHDPHSLEVKFDTCTECHEGLASREDLVNVRFLGSLVDYDGDGDMEEGIYYEIEGLQTMLYQAMQTYATEVAGAGIAYDSASYPYFFLDADNNGARTEGEEGYNAWTPRLAKAAYNYQVSQKDPGEYAHGGKYIIQLLYDSIENLNLALATPVDLSAANRNDHGHFAASEEPFRHWDGEEDGGFVSASCSKCHTATGLPLLAMEGVSITQPASSGLNCTTCHSELDTFARYQFAEVEFPSGATVSFAVDENDTAGLDANLCINCHQGRSSSAAVQRAIGDTDLDTVLENQRFINIHYFAAGATVFGGDVQGAYQYPDKEYVGRNMHEEEFDTCIECHSTHALEVNFEGCSECHENVTTPADLQNIRVSEADFDGDGDVTEGMAGEIATMQEALYAALVTYVGTVPDVPAIIYDSHSSPYFFADANANGTLDEGEERYSTWTPRALGAAFNYQYVSKDPGAFAHNGLYVVQILYDSIESLGGDVTGMTRP